jgi:SAM-dependent methyltransferase
MAISFRRNSAWVRYRLDAGRPYSFRYDENGDLELYDGSHGREDAADLAPYVATPLTVVEKMLEMAEVTENDVVYDLGCGDGRIVITAAKKYGARGVGIDLDPERIDESRRNAREAGVESLVEFRMEDATRADLSDATVVTLYLLTESNALLRPMLEQSLKPGARVISHNYDIPGWDEHEIGYSSVNAPDGEEHSIYLYRR